MGKRIRRLLIVMGVCVSLVSCKKEDISTGANINKKTQIVVWTKDRHDGTFWKDKIDHYNKTNEDDIVVTYKIYNDNYAQAIDNAFQCDSAPDIMAYTDQIFSSNYMKDCFADISPFMDKSFLSTYKEVMFQNVNVIGDKCYFIPTGATTARLFYNKEIFKQAGIAGPPKTMDELIETARTITSQLSNQGVYGFAINFKNSKSALDRSIMRQSTAQLGLKSGFDFQDGEYKFIQYKELIEKWRELLLPDCSYPNCEGLDIDPLRELFSSGKIGMYMSYTHSEYGVYENQFHIQDEWDCAEIPLLDYGRKGSQFYSVNNGYLFNGSSDNLEKAWKVYTEIFANVDNLTEYYKQELGWTIVPKVKERVMNSKKEQINHTIVLNDHDALWPKAPNESYESIMPVDGMDVSDTIKLLTCGTGNIEEELEKLTNRYNKAYREAIANKKIPNAKIDEFNPKKPMLE